MNTNLKTCLLATLAGLLTGAAFSLAPRSALAQTQQQSAAVATLHIDGMESEACPVLVRRAAMQVDGVLKVDASLATHSATIHFDARRTGLAEIRRAIKQRAGFDTVPQD